MKKIFLFLLFSLVLSAQSKLEVFELENVELAIKKKIWVYLPVNYTQTNQKCSVIYMCDGQNLFDKKTAFAGEWQVDETLDSLKANIIVVGIAHGNENRINELTPYPNAKYGGGKTDDFLSFIINTVKPYIDNNYQTKPEPKNTCVFGSSLGGLTALYAAIKHPDVFGKVGCFSPAFWINKSEIENLLKKTKTLNTKIYLMCGDKEDDTMVENLNDVEFLINSIRCKCKYLNKKVIVKNGQHNEKLWREQFAKAYLWLF